MRLSESCHAVGIAQGINSKFEIRIPWGVMLLFDQVEVVIYLIRIKACRQAVKVKGQLG